MQAFKKGEKFGHFLRVSKKVLKPVWVILMQHDDERMLKRRHYPLPLMLCRGGYRYVVWWAARYQLAVISPSIESS